MIDFERQKPVTDEYRAEWERTFGPKRCICFSTIGHHASFCPARDESKCSIHTYKSGCPILNDEERNG